MAKVPPVGKSNPKCDTFSGNVNVANNQVGKTNPKCDTFTGNVNVANRQVGKTNPKCDRFQSQWECYKPIGGKN